MGIVNSVNGLWHYIGSDMAQVGQLCAGVPYVKKNKDGIPIGKATTIEIQPCEYNARVLAGLHAKWQTAALAEAQEIMRQPSRIDESLDECFPFLRPHQLSGMRWLIAKRRALLFDRVRSGKTLTSTCAAIKLSRQLRPQGPVSILIVASKPVSAWWRQELQEKLGLTINGAPAVPNGGVYITHWEYIRRHIEDFVRNASMFDVMIIDEAHRLRNRKGKGYGDIAAISAIIPGLFMLTGTPSDGKPQELWTQLSLVDHKRFKSFWRFCDMFVMQKENYFGRELLGPKNLPVLKSVLDQYSISRSPVNVTRDYTQFPVELPTDIRKLYNELQKEYRLAVDDGDLEAPNTIAALMRLRQMLVSPKLIGINKESVKIDAAVDVTLESVDGGGNVLVFCSFRDAVLEIAKKLNDLDNGIEARALVGGMGETAAVDAANWLNSGSSRVVVSTYGVGSEGLGFHNARTCIIVDRPWSSIACRQSEGRIDKPDCASTYIDLVADNTVDEYIQTLLRDKAEFNNFVIAKSIAQER